MPEQPEANLNENLSQDPIIGIESVQARLRQIERRDWWLWATTIVVMLLLSAAVIIFSAPALSADENLISKFRMEQAV